MGDLVAMWSSLTGAEKLLVLAILIIIVMYLFIKWLITPPRR